MRTKHDIKNNLKKSAVVIFRNRYVENVVFSTFTIKDDDIKEVMHVIGPSHHDD